MMGGFYDSAPKGPAVVLPYPYPTVRAWYVREIDNNRWRGDLNGGRDLLDDGPMMTESGPLDLVLNALKAGSVRQGLPIIVLRTAPGLKGEAA